MSFDTAIDMITSVLSGSSEALKNMQVKLDLARGPIEYYSERQEQFLSDEDREPDGTFGTYWGEVVEIDNAKRVELLKSKMQVVLNNNQKLKDKIKELEAAAAILNTKSGMADACLKDSQDIGRHLFDAPQ